MVYCLLNFMHMVSLKYLNLISIIILLEEDSVQKLVTILVNGEVFIWCP